MAELKILVQRKDELDVNKIVDLVSSVSGAKLAVFHCSINDDGVLLPFVRGLQDKLKLPFVGVRVSATLTNDGFHENSVVVGVFSGDFKVQVHHDKLDFENPEKTIEAVTSKLPEEGLCMVYAAYYPYLGVHLDHLLRNINLKKPRLQLAGAISAPEPFAFTSDGVFSDSLVYCVLNGVDADFKLKSGLEFQEGGGEYTVTKATEYAIQEVDDTNAVSLYCGLKHVRPYFVNVLVQQLSKPDSHKLMRNLSNASETLYESILKSVMELMGSETAEGLVEATYILNLDEGKSEWLSFSYRPPGTGLKWLDNDAKKQLKTYDEVNGELSASTLIVGHECVQRLFYMNFRIKDIERKAAKFRIPLMLSYVYGELGAYLPYTDKNVNVVHGGIMQVLGFK